MRKTTLLAILLAFSSIAFAYPISPRPLRLLVEESQYILTGRVMRIAEQTKKNKKDYYNSHVAVVYVGEVLKGSGLGDSIYISYEPNLICPAPPYFVPETNALIFLDKYKGEYVVHALSYGVKTLDDAGISIYKTRISEIMDIMELSDGPEKSRETLEWLVKCAESKYTRWEGSYELHPGSDFMSFYSDGKVKDFSYYLSSDQLERLKAAVVAAPEFQYALMPMIDIVYRGNEKEMDQCMERFLSTLPENGLWAADEIMKRLQHKIDPDNYRKINEELSEALYRRGSAPDVKKTIEKFIALCRQ